MTFDGTGIGENIQFLSIAEAHRAQPMAVFLDFSLHCKTKRMGYFVIFRAVTVDALINALMH